MGSCKCGCLDASSPIPEQAMYLPFFHLVEPSGNWKGAIDATIAAPRGAEDRARFIELVSAAVMFFTGSVATVTPAASLPNGWPQIRVTARGYYAAVGS